ncbi:MAG: hypothetical protein JXB40_01035 [Candidatus Omnitrophica bacterium]|nr:hypothetical protein [Candidatus Omnitrophota bacterium]
MPHTGRGRGHYSHGRKQSKLSDFRKAKKLCEEISRAMSIFESKYLKTRLHHA